MMETETHSTIAVRPNFEGLPPFPGMGKHISRRHTQAIFYEKFVSFPMEKRKFIPPYTLDMKVKGLVCFRDEYIRLQDPTGYKMAQAYLGGDYTYWELLMKLSWFSKAKKEWDKELDAKIFSEAIDEIQKMVKEAPAPTALAAAKFLLQKGYKPNASKTARGRPTSDEVHRELVVAAEEEKSLLADLERIKVVK